MGWKIGSHLKQMKSHFTKWFTLAKWKKRVTHEKMGHTWKKCSLHLENRVTVEKMSLLETNGSN